MADHYPSFLKVAVRSQHLMLRFVRTDQLYNSVFLSQKDKHAWHGKKERVGELPLHPQITKKHNEISVYVCMYVYTYTQTHTHTHKLKGM